MPTVFVYRAYRIVIYLNDHGPAHVHAVGPGGNARFSLGDGPGEVRLMDVGGIGKRDLRGIAAAIIDRHDQCLEAWRSIHGNQDPD